VVVWRWKVSSAHQHINNQHISTSKTPQAFHVSISGVQGFVWPVQEKKLAGLIRP